MRRIRSSLTPSFRSLGRAAGLALALPLGLGLLTAHPATGVAALALADGPAPVKLAPLPKPKTPTVKTKAGTTIPVWLWPGSDWTGSPDWFPSARTSGTQPATGEIVLIVYDSGDKVSIEPVVQMLRAMGATVVAFDNPIIAFDNPIIAFDHPIIAFEDPLVGKGDAFEDPLVGKGDAGEDVVHAMITWASTHAIRDGERHRVTLFGVGRGADLALKVGAKRTDDLRGVILDSPIFESPTHTLLPIGDTQNARKAFRGVWIVRTNAAKFGRQKVDGVTLAPEATTFPMAANIGTLATDGAYQRAVAEFIAAPGTDAR